MQPTPTCFFYQAPEICRKKTSVAARLRFYASKLSWVVIVLLLCGMLYLHSHKTKLAKNLDAHKEERTRLVDQVAAKDGRVKGMTRELHEAQQSAGAKAAEVRGADAKGFRAASRWIGSFLVKGLRRN